MSDLEVRLRAALDGGRFALIGAGQLGTLLLNLWPPSVPRPEFVLDSSKTGHLQDLEILDLKQHRPIPGIVYLLCAFKLPSADVRPIFAALDQSVILTAYDFLDRHCPNTFSNGWRHLEPSPEVLSAVAISRAAFSDSVSLQAHDAASAWRYRRELVANYPVGIELDKYNLALVGRESSFYDHVYDCGAYDLGLTKSLSKAKVRFGSYLAIEPDPTRYDACLAQAAAVGGLAAGPIAFERRAVCDRSGSELFLANGLFSARLLDRSPESPACCVTAETCTLDDLHEDRHGWRDSQETRVLLKVHVEGAEPRALRGARRLIEQARTDVLINISHNEASFLEVPRALADFGLFDLHLRSDALFGEGLTLFARRRD